jgi:hypothetical protein
MRLFILGFLLCGVSISAFAQSDILILESGETVPGTVLANVDSVRDSLLFRRLGNSTAEQVRLAQIREVKLADGKRLIAVNNFPDGHARLMSFIIEGEVSFLRFDDFLVLRDGAGNTFPLSRNNYQPRLRLLLQKSPSLGDRIERSEFRATDIESILIAYYELPENAGLSYVQYPWKSFLDLRLYAAVGGLQNVVFTPDAQGELSFREGEINSSVYGEIGLQLHLPFYLIGSIGLRYQSFAGSILANVPTALIDPLYYRSDLRALLAPVGFTFVYNRTRLRPFLGAELVPGWVVSGRVYRESTGNTQSQLNISNTFIGTRLKTGLGYRFNTGLEVGLLVFYDDYSAFNMGEGTEKFSGKARGIGVVVTY